MAEIALTQQNIVRAGLADPAGDSVVAANYGTILNDGELIFRVVWGATPGTLTVTTPVTVGADPTLAVADHTVAFGAAATKWVGKFPTGIYNDPTTGKITLDPDQNCTITAFKAT